jgi:hypothetical protein
VLSLNEWHLDARLDLALAYLFLEREEEARAEAVEILRRYPTFNLERLKRAYTDPSELVQTLKVQREMLRERR